MGAPHALSSLLFRLVSRTTVLSSLLCTVYASNYVYAFIARAHGLYRLMSIISAGETGGKDGVLGHRGGKSDNEDTPAEDWRVCVCEGLPDPRERSGVPCE